jgi:phosphoglycolate phosphatase
VRAAGFGAEGQYPVDHLGLIIFDMDGTLLDSMREHVAAFSCILKADYDMPPSASRSVYLQTAGAPLDQQFALAIQSHAGRPPFRLDSLIDRFWALVGESEPTPFPDVRDSIEQLWRAGYLLVVSSGCSGEVVAGKMTKSGLAGYFRVMLGTDYREPGLAKGEGHFDLIRRELRLDLGEFSSNTVLVGDGEHDMAIAKNAGIYGIGRLTGKNGDALGKAGANLVIDTLDELVSILRDGPAGSGKFRSISALKDAAS